jgi:hypothetical protein
MTVQAQISDIVPEKVRLSPSLRQRWLIDWILIKYLPAPFENSIESPSVLAVYTHE